MSLEEWLSSHSPTPSPFCFDCAFLPEPHELCMIHSLQQQQSGDLGLEDEGRSGSDIGREGNEKDGPQPILHSTPQAGEGQVACFKTPDLELLVPGPKSAHDEVPLALAWSFSMATPPLQCSGSAPRPFPVVGRTTERRFLLEANVSVASTDVSTLAHSLLDEDILVNTKHNRLNSKPEDGTPCKGDRGTSPDRRKLVALFNIRGNQLEGEVHSPTSPPSPLGQPLHPEKENIVLPDEGTWEGPAPASNVKCCYGSNLRTHCRMASLSPVSHVTTSPCMTPLDHEPSLKDSSFVDCMIGSQDLFDNSPEPAISPSLLTPCPPPCTGVGGTNEKSCSLSNTLHELEKETATMTSFEGKCDSAATVLECPRAVPVEDYSCMQEDCSNTPREASSTVCSPCAHVAASSSVAATTGGASCEGRPVEVDHDKDTIHHEGQAGALCIATTLGSVQTCSPIPVSSSPVAKQVTGKRPCKKKTAKFLYPSNRQQIQIKRNSLADSKDDHTAVTSGVSALAQSVLAARKNAARTEQGLVQLPVEKPRMFQNHRLPSGKEVHAGGHDSLCGGLDKEEGKSVLQAIKEFPVTSNNSVPSMTVPHSACNQQESDGTHTSCRQEDRLCQNNKSQVVADHTCVAGGTLSPMPEEQGKVHVSREAVSVSQIELQMSSDAVGKAKGDENVHKVLPPARKRKRPSRNRWSRRRKKRKDDTEDCDKEEPVDCINSVESSDLGPVDLGAKMAEDVVQQTASIANEGEEGVQHVDTGGNKPEEGVQVQALAIGCMTASGNTGQLDSVETFFGNDAKPPNQRMPSTAACAVCHPSEPQHAFMDGTGRRETCSPSAASGEEDGGTSKLLLQQAGPFSHPLKSSITSRPSVSRKPLSDRDGQEPRVHRGAVSRRSTGSGFKAPRLAANVPLAEENAARSKILRGFGVPTRPASVMTGAQQLLHSAGKEIHASLKAEDSSTHSTVQGDVEQVQAMDTRVKDSCQGLALTGFSTASGAECTVSSSTLDRVKPLLMGEDVVVLPDMSSHGSVPAGTGFSTASGRGCLTTSGSLRKAEALPNDTKEGNSQSGSMDSMFTGFSTAGGRKCTVSASALRKAEKLCDDPSESTARDAPAVSGPPHTLTGFTTASGGSCSVSASALRKAEKLCGDPSESAARDAPAVSGPPHTLTGFTTASGGLCSVSASALRKAEKLCGDPSESAARDAPAVSGPPRALTGFTTASGGSCSVSASALSMGQHLCSEIAGEVGHTEPAHTGFSTAGGNRISVSGSAVSRVKHLFTDLMTEEGMEVHPVGVSGSMVNSTKEEGCGRLSEPPTETDLEGLVDAKENFVGNSMDTSVPGGQDIEGDLQDFDMETFAAFTQLPQQIASRETSDAVSLDSTTAANILAIDGQSKIEESREATDDTLIAEAAHFALEDCHREEGKENVSTSSTVSLERSACEVPYLDTQMVQQMLESTAISGAGSEDTADEKGLADDGASFNLTLSLANLGEGFSQLGEDDSKKEEDGAVVTCPTPHPSMQVLEEVKEAEGTKSLNSQLLEIEQCFSLTQFDMSNDLTDIAEGIQDSTTLDHKPAQGGAVVDEGGGAANEGQETVREEEGEIVLDTRGRVMLEGGGMTVDEKQVTVMEEGKEAAPNIEGGVMTEEDGGVLMENFEVGMTELKKETVMEKGKGRMEADWTSANEVGGRCAKISQLAEDIPTEVQKDALTPDALEQPLVDQPTSGLPFSGLQTASGKQVTVSRAALEVARSMLNPTTSLSHHPSCSEEFTSAAKELVSKNSSTSPKLEERAMYVGLQTASGKCVPISDEAMEHVAAQRWVQGGGGEGEGAVKAEQPAANFHGLQTASGKAISVSEAALKAVRSLTHEPCTSNASGAEQEEDCCSSHFERPPHHFVGLQTASGKKVEVAAESLEHVRSSSSGGSSSTALHGFSTAGGKVVNISELALHHVKSRLGGILGAPGFPGLQTAGGTPVEVSVESLAHVKAERGAVVVGGSSRSPSDVQMEAEEDRQVEVAVESLPSGSGSLGDAESEDAQLTTAGGRKVSVLENALRAVQQERVAQGAPPSNEKNRTQPLQPAMGAGTSNAPPPVKEGGVPAVAKYTPRFKPQASAGSRGTAPRKMVDENKTPLAATTFQSPQTATFKPSYHSTPEAYLADRHRGLGGTPLKPLHSTAMETPTNHHRGKPCGTASTGQRKRFVYSVPLRGRLPTAMRLSRPVQPQPICAREDGSTSLPTARMGLSRASSFNTTPVWPAGLRRPQSRCPVLLASSTPKQACESSLHGARPSYPTATSLPCQRAGLRDGDQRTIAVRLDLDESCPSEPLPEPISHYEAMPEGTSPAVVLCPPHQPQDRCTQQAQTPLGIGKLPPDVLHGEAVDVGDDLTDSQLTLFMDMTQLEQSQTAGLGKADGPYPVATADRQQSLSTSRHQEELQSTKGSTTHSTSTLQPTALSPVLAGRVVEVNRRESNSPLGNATAFMFEEDSGIGTMPTSNSTSIRHPSSPAPSPNCTAHPEPFKEECSNVVRQEETQRGSLQGKKRAGECQSEPRPSKRRKDGNVNPLNNTFMHMTTVRGVGRSCPIRPQGGTLYSIKRSCERSRQPLSLLTQGLPPWQHTEHQLLAMGVPSFVLGVSAANAVEFRFEGRLFFSASVLAGQGVRVGDGAVLHLGEDGCAGAGELERAFCTTPGVDPRLVPHHWFRNHYRWLVWKLAAMEVCFPQHLAGRCLTPNWLMTQMKYRYDREIDNAQRSALRKIYEHDDTPAKTMVLCVCKVSAPSTERTRRSAPSSGGGSTASMESSVDEPVVELTDGWYSIPAVFDSVLRYHLRQGTIAIGTKLITCGAELAGSDEPCSPLEAPSSVVLKLTANSTRRARWDTKLGFHRHAKPFHIPLSSVQPDGGKVGCTSFTVARVYPLLCMERRADGSKAFRTKRAEEKAARASDIKRQKIIEGICERERKEFEKEVQQEDAGSQPLRSRRRLNSKQIMGLDDGEDIYRAMHQVADPQSFQECLSVTQKTLLLSYKETVDARRRDELQRRISSAIEEAEEEELPPKREVVPFLKMKVTETSSDMGRAPSDAVFCVWRPSEDLRQLLKEGYSYRVYSLQASEGRGGLQLTATKFTQYEEVSSTENGQVAAFCPRKVTPICDLTEGGQDHPYGEVDTVGLVIHVSSTVVTTARGEVALDSIYLADQDGNMVTVKVWEGLSALGYEDLVRPCVLLSASNLQVQPPSGRSTLPSLQARDVSVFSQSPRDQHLNDAMHLLKGALPAKVKDFCDSLLDYVHF